MPTTDSSSRPGFVLTVDERTPALLTLAGNTPRLERFDLGTSVVYPFEPQDGLDVAAALAQALDASGLDERAHGARRVTLLISDPALPQPAMRGDVRAQLLEAVLDRLARAGVDDVALVFATGLGRRLTDEAAERVVGERVWRSFHVLNAITSHDAEAEDLVSLGEAAGVEVRVNRRVAESDLVIDVRAVSETPLVSDAGARGYLDIALGASGTDTVQGIRGALAQPNAAADVAGVIAGKLSVFSVAAVLGQPRYRGPLGFTGEREWEWKSADRLSYKGIRSALQRFPDPTSRRVFRELSAGYPVVGVFAGEPNAVAAEVEQCLEATQGVAVPEPADLLAIGVPHPNPAGDGSVSNPVAAAWSALARGGYAANPALVREGGSLVVFHPLTPRFSTRLHLASSDFWAEALADGPSVEAVSAHEERLRSDPWLLQLYRERSAFHPLQPFHLWYACQPAIRRAHEVIYVGAKRDNAARLGGRAASRLSDALEIARANVGGDARMTYIHNTGPIVVKAAR